MTTTITGQRLAAELRKTLSIGTRTRTRRRGLNLHEEMIEALMVNMQYPGYYNPERTTVFNAAYAVACAWKKHFDGYRIDAKLRYEISKMSPWRLAGLLGEMLDAGVSNTFEGELFFQRKAQEIRGLS